MVQFAQHPRHAVDLACDAGGRGDSPLHPWRCPLCAGDLSIVSADNVGCTACRTEFPAVDGIPDLRVRGSSPIRESPDLAEARALAAKVGPGGPEAIVKALFAHRPWNEATKALRVRQTLASPDKLRAELEGWLAPCLMPTGIVLDIGCGAGGLLAAVAQLGFRGAGIDSSMPLLVVAKRMIEAHGGKPTLACAFAESLPMADDAVGAVTLYDMIEHVDDPNPVITEACRVVQPSGHLAISTPNRFSLAAEPHVFLWGVGWLPRPLQEPYVRWRGRTYRGTRLLSAWEMSRLLRAHSELEFELRVPRVPDEEVRHFNARRATLARLYNRIAARPTARILLLTVGPFFQLVARRLPPVSNP
jgi:SAM-dependent methyltransferase